MSALRAIVAAAVERHSSACLDIDGERDAVIDDVVAAVLASPDAQLIRHAFANAPTSCTRLIVTRELGGKRESEVLDAAYRLAGGGA